MFLIELYPGPKVLGAAGAAALIVRLFVVLAFQRLGGAGLKRRTRFVAVLLFLLLQLLADGIGQIDLRLFGIFAHYVTPL